MRREERFVMSHRPYAVRLGSLRSSDGWSSIDAAWFRRKNGILSAHLGDLHDLQQPDPLDVQEFLLRYDDGRYGGSCDARWDGENYWGSQKPFEQSFHLSVLEPMLENFPAVPDGYDGWWTFR